MKKIVIILILLFTLTTSGGIVPLYDPYAVHVDGLDALAGNWSLGGYNLTNGGIATFENVHISSGETYDLILEADTVEYGQDYTLTFNAGESNKTITMTGSPTLDNWFNQDVRTTALSVQFGHDFKVYGASGTIIATIESDDGRAGLNLDGVISGADGTIGAIQFLNNRTGLAAIYTERTGADDAAALIFQTKATGGALTDRLTIAPGGDVTMSGDLAVTGEVSGGTADFGATTVDSLTLDMTQDFLFTQRTGVPSLAIQGQTAGQTTQIEVFTASGDGSDNISISLYALGSPSSVVDSESLSIGFVETYGLLGSAYVIGSYASGTGDAHPIYMVVADAEQFVLGADGDNTMSGALGVTGTVTGATGSVFGTLTLADGSITDSGGTITFADENLTTTGNITLDSDSNKLLLGDGQDLEIYHDGSNSYIDNNTGHLFIRNLGIQKNIFATGSPGGDDEGGGGLVFSGGDAGDKTIGGNGLEGGCCIYTAGPGGDSDIAGGIANVGGKGGTLTFAGGLGGAATNGTDNTSGEGGKSSFRGGRGGTGSTGIVGGIGGEILVQGGYGGVNAINETGGCGGDTVIKGGDAGSGVPIGTQGDGGNVVINGGAGNTKGHTEIGDGTNKTSFSYTGDVTFAGSAGFYPRVLNQAAAPTAGTGATQIDTGELLLWADSDDGDRLYLVSNFGGTVCKVEMGAI